MPSGAAAQSIFCVPASDGDRGTLDKHTASVVGGGGVGRGGGAHVLACERKIRQRRMFAAKYSSCGCAQTHWQHINRLR